MEQQRSALTVLGRDNNGNPKALAVDTMGQLLATMQGIYEGASKTIAVDQHGRMLVDALLMDSVAFDFSKFYTGCDRRFCVGDDTLFNLAYRIRALNSELNVIRYISVIGSAIDGYYMVTMGALGEWCRGVVAHESVVDTHVIKFGNIGADFDITFNNCTVKGIIADIKTPTNRLESGEVTYVVGDETNQGYKTMDYDVLTYISKVLSGDATVWEISFPATDISSVCSHGDVLITSPSTVGVVVYIEYYADGAWVQIKMMTYNSSPGGSWKYYDYIPKTNVSKCRITVIRGNAGTVTINIRDITILKNNVVN